MRARVTRAGLTVELDATPFDETAAPLSGTSCPEPDALVALVEGRATIDVREHVMRCDGCSSVLALLSDYPAPKTDSQSHPSTASASSFDVPFVPLARGKAMGRYVLERVVGVGAMGAVYAARDPHLYRTVAIKVLSGFASGQSESARQQRLIREARALARLSHPNVVSVYDVGLEEGRVFIVMELVRGATLREYVREHRPSRDQLLDIFIQAGNGLAAAHEAGLVHRDFKPDNVLIGDDGRVRVTDFGLAHGPRDPTEAGDADAPPLEALALSSGVRATRTGAVVGTPAYMAPEQRNGTPDARSDQYSFCVALHEMLTGVRATAGLGVRVERALGSGLTAALERGLQPDPAQRFESMDALLNALTRRSQPRLGRIAVGWGAIAVVTLGGVLWATANSAPHTVSAHADVSALPASEPLSGAPLEARAEVPAAPRSSVAAGPSADEGATTARAPSRPSTGARPVRAARPAQSSPPPPRMSTSAPHDVGADPLDQFH